MFYRALKAFAILASASAIDFPLTAAVRGPSLPEPTGDY